MGWVSDWKIDDLVKVVWQDICLSKKTGILCLGLLSLELIHNDICGHFFHELAEKVLEEVLFFLLRNILLLLSCVLYGDEDCISKLLTPPPAGLSNVIELFGQFIGVFLGQGLVFFLENSALKFGWRYHMLDNCLCVVCILEDFVS